MGAKDKTRRRGKIKIDKKKKLVGYQVYPSSFSNRARSRGNGEEKDKEEGEKQ